LAVAYASSEAGLIRRDIAAEDVDRARGDLKAAQALVDAGKEASLRVAQAQAGLSSAEAIAASREAEAAAALEQLSVLAGRAEPYSGTSESLLVREWVAPAIANVDSASVLSAKADVDASDAVLRTERFKRAPDLNLTAGRRNFAAGGDALVVGVSLSIPLFDRNSGGISAARARSDAARARLDAARLQSQADRATALARVDAAKRGLIAASKGEEAATEAYRMARLGYEAGRTPLVELLLSRRTLTDARLSVVDARLARVAAYASLAVASGQIAFGDM
jgi:cobalt-zinc-cadmium efflux system outer membrane protein